MEMKNTKATLGYNDLSQMQKDAIRFILNRKVGCLAPDCGGGKTCIALTLFQILKKKGLAKNMLVTCTPKGIKETWKTEHLKWSHLEDLNIVALTGDPSKRARLLQRKNVDVVFCISYNSLKWLMEQPNCPKFDVIFADEGSCLKGHNSQWREALIAIAGDYTEYKVISSATPAPHDAIDYWGLCRFMDGAECLGTPNITMFRRRYCYPIVIRNREIWKIDEENTKIVTDAVKHLFFSAEISDEAKIPIKEVMVKIDLSPEAKEIYLRVRNEQCLKSIVKDAQGRINTVDSLDAMQLSNKLAQMTNGFVYVDEALRLSDDVLLTVGDPHKLLKQKSRVAIDLFDDRIRAFKKLIAWIHKKHGEDQQIVIPYLFKYDLEQLKKALPGAVSDEENNIVERWNGGKIKYLLLQYTRSAKSLNLQEKGHIVAVYSRTFKFEDWYQIIRRVARQGQKAPEVLVYILHMKGTIDERKQKTSSDRAVEHRRFQKQIIAEAEKSK